MRAWVFLVGSVVVAGCHRAAEAPVPPPALDVESARAALIEGIASAPEKFLSYGEPEHLDALRHARPTPEPGWPEGTFHLDAGDNAGPLHLSGFRIVLTPPSYWASRYTVERVNVGERQNFVDHLEGIFSYDQTTGKWQASAPHRIAITKDASKN
jgi:hypothetical protein